MDVFLQMLALGNEHILGHRLGSGAGAPAWLPEGAVAGVDYTEGEAWLSDTLITDLSTIHGDSSNPSNGQFDPTAITAAGMAVTMANTNRPTATNELSDVFFTNDFCMLYDWDQLDYNEITGGLFFTANEDGGDSNYTFAKVGQTGDVIWADGNNGQYNTIGTVTENARNKVAASANAAGWLVSLNGATAVADTPVTPPMTSPPLKVKIGCKTASGDNAEPLNGTIRRIIFYPNEQNAAFVEALAAL